MKGEIHSLLVTAVGSRLVELRRQKGYSNHEDFAYDFDLPRYQYWRLEKGKANFTIKTLIRVLNIHNVTPEEFFISLKTADGLQPKQK